MIPEEKARNSSLNAIQVNPNAEDPVSVLCIIEPCPHALTYPKPFRRNPSLHSRRNNPHGT
jgi:hypothetical protein